MTNVPSKMNHTKSFGAGPCPRRQMLTGILAVVIITVMFSCLSLSIAAERPPDAGTILETIKDRPQKLPDQKAPALTVEPPAKSQGDAPSGKKIPVKTFRMTGNTVFTEARLLSLLADFTNKELNLSDMRSAAGRITAYYRKNGYFVAQAYLPEQDIKDGVVTITVIEGKIGQVEIRVEKDARLPDGTIRGILDQAAPSGDLIHKNNIERGLLLVNDLPGVEVQSTLKPGATVGTADLVMELKRRFPVSVSIDFDNYGNRYTGYYRGGAAVSVNNLAGVGESINIRALTAGNGLFYGRGSFALPIGPLGTRAGVAYSYMGYKLGDDYEALGAKGSAHVASVYVLHPFIRSRNLNLYGHAQYDHKDLQDRIESVSQVTNKELHTGTFALDLDARDDLLGGGASNITVSLVCGQLNIRSDDARQTDATTAQTDGNYGKALLNLSRLQRLPAHFSFYAAARGQLAFNNLDSSEKFTLGGPNGVRSYPVNEAFGDSAYIVTGEVRYGLPKFTTSFDTGTIQLSGFLDAGESWSNKSPWVGATGDNRRSLAGAGLGLDWNIRHFSLRTSYAWTLGPEKATSDEDRGGCFWIQAVLWF